MQPFLFPTPLIKVIYKFVQIGLVLINSQLLSNTAAYVVDVCGLQVFSYMYTPQANNIETSEMDFLISKTTLFKMCYKLGVVTLYNECSIFKEHTSVIEQSFHIFNGLFVNIIILCNMTLKELVNYS